MKLELDDWVAYQDEDLGQQFGQIVRLFRVTGSTRDDIRYSYPPIDTCAQIRWFRDYSHELPGSVHESYLRKISPLEMLAMQA